MYDKALLPLPVFGADTICQYTTLHIDPVGYSKNPTNGTLKLMEYSLNNKGKSSYLHLVQGRHDGLIFIEVQGENQATCLH